MTPAQERYLAEIRERPGRSYNGRARRPLEALRKLGLITFDYELVPHIGAWTERFTCWPVERPSQSPGTRALEQMLTLPKDTP